MRAKCRREMKGFEHIRAAKQRILNAQSLEVPVRVHNVVVVVTLPAAPCSVAVQILANLSRLQQPWNCPHGRPTMRHLLDVGGLRRPQRTDTHQTTQSVSYKRLAALAGLERTGGARTCEE